MLKILFSQNYHVEEATYKNVLNAQLHGKLVHFVAEVESEKIDIVQLHRLSPSDIKDLITLYDGILIVGN